MCCTGVNEQEGDVPASCKELLCLGVSVSDWHPHFSVSFALELTGLHLPSTMQSLMNTMRYHSPAGR